MGRYFAFRDRKGNVIPETYVCRDHSHGENKIAVEERLVDAAEKLPRFPNPRSWGPVRKRRLLECVLCDEKRVKGEPCQDYQTEYSGWLT